MDNSYDSPRTFESTTSPPWGPPTEPPTDVVDAVSAPRRSRSMRIAAGWAVVASVAAGAGFIGGRLGDEATNAAASSAVQANAVSLQVEGINVAAVLAASSRRSFRSTR